MLNIWFKHIFLKICWDFKNLSGRLKGEDDSPNLTNLEVFILSLLLRRNRLWKDRHICSIADSLPVSFFALALSKLSASRTVCSSRWDETWKFQCWFQKSVMWNVLSRREKVSEEQNTLQRMWHYNMHRCLVYDFSGVLSIGFCFISLFIYWILFTFLNCQV